MSNTLLTFFEHVSEEQWYLMTGNGFPLALYTVFKIMWLRDNEPEIFPNLVTSTDVLGTLTALGSGGWDDFSSLMSIHQEADRKLPAAAGEVTEPYTRFLKANSLSCAFAQGEKDE